MIFTQSSYNYQTRSSNHGHPVQCTARFLHSLRCTEFGCPYTIRTRVHLRDTAAASHINLGTPSSRITDTEPAIYERDRHVIDDNS